MSDILCRWLNEELRLSRAVEPKTFAKDFSSGYLIGEVLHKYQLQNDFNMFMKKDTSVSKLNNFTRLEPTLRLLGISFDVATAQGLMDEKQGVATHILYQLYLSLEKKKKAEIRGTIMEIMQPAATAGLHKKEHEIYCDRLHKLVKRDAELKLQKICQHYDDKFQQVMNRSVMAHPVQQQRPLKVQDEKKVCRQKPSELVTHNQTALIQLPKPPPKYSLINMKKKQQQQQQQRQQRRQQQAQAFQNEIAQFETNKKKLATSTLTSPLSRSPYSRDFLLSGTNQSGEVTENQVKPQLQSNSEYIQKIRQRLQEDALAREQREKRVDRFLVEQLKAHEAQEEASRDEYLVKRLTRQTQQEQRLVAQLLQIRKQKEVIVKNRLFREQQIQQRREKDFKEALEREAALARQAKLDRAEDIKKEREFCNKIAAERAQKRYEKHFKSCKNIVEQIVDLATKVGEYHQLTGNLIPEKHMREWKELLFSGLPLYEPIETEGQQFEFSTPLDPVELKKQETLNNQDYDEYTNMVGEWVWPEEAGETQLPPTNNNILGHVVVRLRNIAQPPIVKPAKPSFPHFTLKACVLGKICTGKTTCLAKITEAHGFYVLSAGTLLDEAIKVYRNGEELSTQATLGASADKEMRAGKAVPDELLVDIIVEAIRQIPANSGWILDGFPADITQAYLLEKALGGAVEGENDVISNRINLALDPDPPKPPPPPAPALDVVLLLDIPDEHVTTRGYNHIPTDTDAAIHSDPSYKSLYLAQIPHRIVAFQDSWPKLEEWFGQKQNILVHVDANVEKEELCRRIEAVLQEVMNKPKKDVVLDSGNAVNSGTAQQTTSVKSPPAHQAPALAESHTSLNEEKTGNETDVPTEKGQSGMATPRSVSNEDNQGAPKSPESASPYPGSFSLPYVDEPVPPELPEYLCTHWDTVCESYVNTIKAVMQELRPERTCITHHLYNLREEFKHFLARPDLKQELVSQWQKEFNNVPDDMRDDEETKAELHQRLDDLRERLWDMSDKRKEEDEQEWAAVMGDGWLEDHTALLINHHSTLTQAELDRFQDTFCLLRVYYLSMCKQVLPEPITSFVCIPLLGAPDMTTQEESCPSSNEAAAAKTHGHMDDGGEDRKTLHPDSSGAVTKTNSQHQTEPAMSPHDKLISDYEEALTTIRNLVSGETLQSDMETKLQKEKQEKEKPASAHGKNKKEQSAKKKKGAPSPPPPAPSPVPDEEKNPELKALRIKVYNEYAAALDHEERAAKVRIALVKGHGLAMVQSLKNSAEQTSSSMKQWLEARFVTEMKSIDQLTEVVRHHIESAAKLQNELILDSTNFYLNGDCHMVANPPPPSRPPSLEKPSQSTLTIVQLELLNRQFYDVAPSGLIASFDFYNVLMDITSVNMGRDSLPERWMKMNETQLMEIVSLLKDEHELVDWRRFLLSCALPWPLPTLTQLLTTLQQFKAADSGETGYINEEQYLQTQLWFSNDCVQSVPEDPSDPLPYDRFSNLRKFFFQLFADHSVCPPHLDYVSMLQYFAADPNPKQGFIRALSVVQGQHLKQSSSSHLVKSMPSIVEDTEFSSPELCGEDKEQVNPCTSSSFSRDQEVSLPTLATVTCHRGVRVTDSDHLPPSCMSQAEHTEVLECVFRELGYRPEDRVPFSVLCQHPVIQDQMETSTKYQFINIHRVLLADQEEGEIHNMRPS
ncbi:sperm flagellar protein 2 [Sphaeramia orbicularis]|uniref:sperm flagellar protein 2 n=1 Tax=Sphaeramia orbicularis TaxID=375764 RepID=UPI00117EDF44|nr:sperm flagellar protein 2 [Sphaeramia orbicularis]